DATSDQLTLRFDGAATPRLVGQEELTSRSNYFIGDDSTQWHTNVPNYGSVVYQGLAPGVDAVFYSTSAGQLEYDLRLAPAADASAVTLRWEGAQALSV